MEEEKEVSGAEEYVVAEIELAEPLNPEQEKNLRDSFEKLEPHTLESCDVGAKKISLCYDPTRTSKERLMEMIRQAGGKPGQVESESSPLL